MVLEDKNEKSRGYICIYIKRSYSMYFSLREVSTCNRAILGADGRCSSLASI